MTINEGQVHAVNSAGLAVGVSRDAGGASWPVYWLGLEAINLGTFGGDNNVAHGVNSLGKIVGQSGVVFFSKIHAFLYENGILYDLGVPSDFGDRSSAIDINDSDQVAARAIHPVGITRPYLWEGGVWPAVPFLGNDSLRAINNNGQLVGAGIPAGATTPVVLFWSGGTVVDLNTLLPAGSGWQLTIAHDLNRSSEKGCTMASNAPS